MISAKTSLVFRVFCLVGLVALLVSCAPQATPSPAPTQAPAAATAAPTAAAPAPTSAPAPTTGAAAKPKVLRFTESWPTYIDPAVGSDYSSSVSLANLYDSLVFPNDDGTVKPWVATKWDISPDGLKYTFTLQKGIKFHNGDELTAEDVVFSMQRILTIGEGYGYLFTTTVDSARAVDPYTVEFTLKKPFGPFVPALVRLYILNKKQVMANIEKTGQGAKYGDMGDYGKKWLLTHDAGSGPYMVKEFKLEEYLLAEKFPGYWKPIPADAPDSFKFIGTTEATTVRTLMGKKELEISDQWQTSEALDALSKINGVQVASFYAGSVLNVMLHNRKPPTDDINFRKALAYAIDYDTIVSKLFPGSKQAIGPCSFVLPGHDSSLTPYKRDVAKAKEYLAKSKYAAELDKHPLDLVWVSEVPDEEKIALLIQANAAEIGIKVNVIKQPWGSVVESVGKEDTTPTALIIFVAPHYAEAGSMLESRYHSKSAGTWEQTEWLKDPEIDRMIEDAISTADQEQRFAKYKEVQKKLYDLCPSLWLFDQAEKHAYWDQYIDWKAADLAKASGKANPVMGYNFYMPDIKVFPDKM